MSDDVADVGLEAQVDLDGEVRMVPVAPPPWSTLFVYVAHNRRTGAHYVTSHPHAYRLASMRDAGWELWRATRWERVT